MDYLIQQCTHEGKQFLAVIDISQILRDDLGRFVLSDTICASYLPGELCRYFTKISLPKKLSLPLGEHKLIEHSVSEKPPASVFTYESNQINLLYQRNVEVPPMAIINGIEPPVELSDLRPNQMELFIEAIGWNLSED